MEVAEAAGLESRIMDKGQPSVSSQDESGQGDPQVSRQGVDNREEIKSVDSGAGVSNRNTEPYLDQSEGISLQEGIDAGPSSIRGENSGEARVRVDDVDFSRLNESSGAERAGNEENLEEGDVGHKEDNPPFADTVVDTGAVQSRPPAVFYPGLSFSPDKSRGSHLIDIPSRDGAKVEELDSYKGFAIARTASNFSVESGTGDQCRICQQHTEEPLMELGCHCRGELAKAHRSCVDHWFGNKGTNKCEVCQHVAVNVPLPSSHPTPHFWVWRVGGPYNGAAPRRAGGARFHPLWAALLILIAGLLFDILISIFLGASALPVNIIIGVLVVLGLGTAARLVLECWHERVIRRNIRRMEEEPNFDDFPAEQPNINIHVDPRVEPPVEPPPVEPPVEAQPSFTNVSPETTAIEGAAGASQVATTTSNIPPT